MGGEDRGVAWGAAGLTHEEEDRGPLNIALGVASPLGWTWAMCVFKGRQPRELVSLKGRVKSRAQLPPTPSSDRRAVWERKKLSRLRIPTVGVGGPSSQMRGESRS